MKRILFHLIFGIPKTIWIYHSSSLVILIDILQMEKMQKERFILYETYWDDNLFVSRNMYTCIKRMIRENKISINVHST